MTDTTGKDGMLADRTAMLEAFYRAFNDRDLDAFLDHLAPGVELPDILTGGETHGRDEIPAFCRKQWQEIDPIVEPMRINFTGDGSAHVLVDQLIRALDGEVLQNRRVEHVFEFEGPFIRRLTVVGLAQGEIDRMHDDDAGGEGGDDEGGPGGEAGE
jgi:limonene-1,2-epoxide hydrolase